jgi:SAM-dependent methyltransferase
MPHTLDSHVDPHATLREVARVLVPDGRVVISGFNPSSLWGLRFRRERLTRRLGWGQDLLPALGDPIGYWRLRDWLHLLDFDIEVGRFGVYGPVMRTEVWQSRFAWMATLGTRWCPIVGAAYFLVAVKRVHCVRLLETKWKSVKQRATATVPLAQRGAESQALHTLEEESGFEPR